MKKKLLVVLVAGLLLLTAVACGDNDKPSKDTGTEATGTGTGTESYIQVGTDESGNAITAPVTEAPTDPAEDDPSVENPTFTDISKTVVVITNRATVRSATVIDDTTGISWPAEGTTLTVTGECEDWYRIEHEIGGEKKTCYITKSVVDDASALEGFTRVEGEGETITISTGNEDGAVNVRSYPSSASDKSIRGTLKEGATATRVAIGEKWSIILFGVQDDDGNAVTKEYYISNDCIKTAAAESDSTAE